MKFFFFFISLMTYLGHIFLLDASIFAITEWLMIRKEEKSLI